MIFSKLHHPVPWIIMLVCWIVDIGIPDPVPCELSNYTMCITAPRPLDIYIWDQYFANLRLERRKLAKNLCKTACGMSALQLVSKDIHLKSGQGVPAGILEKSFMLKVREMTQKIVNFTFYQTPPLHDSRVNTSTYFRTKSKRTEPW